MADKPAPTAPSSANQVAAFVEPLRAGGAVLGFVIGFVATHRMGGAVAECTLHGLLGALLLGPVGWFLGLVLIRESIRANVEDQRHAYDNRVREAKRELAQKLAASGHSVPNGLLDPVDDSRRLGPGGG